jgi:predicted RND superfamily exporter protein
VGSKRFKEMSAQMIAFMEQHPSKKWLNYRITGSVVLMDKNNNNLFDSLWQSLLIAFVVIGGIIGVLYKSFKFVLVSLLTNILPLLVIAGIMGYAGLSLKLSTTIVFTIAFGIAVDDTIHFLSKLRIELNKGRSLLYAIKATYFSAGKAIVLTSLVLCGGFLILAMSSFLGTFYLGLLVSITLLMAVVSDLFLLPALLVLTAKPAKQKKGE